MNHVRAMIVDDELPARFNLSEAIAEYPRWQVVCELGSANNIEDDVEKYTPDVIFLDISMPGMSGLDAARSLRKASSKPHIIFVTAYDEFAVQAFELYAVDYLLKPFDNTRFAQCIARIDALLARAHEHTSGLDRYLDGNTLDRLVIKSTASVRVIDINDVMWLKSNGNYIDVHHTHGCHLLRGSLSQLEKHLDGKKFLRVHRQVIIKLNQARELKSLSDDKNILFLANGDSVSVSERYRRKFLEVWAES